MKVLLDTPHLSAQLSQPLLLPTHRLRIASHPTSFPRARKTTRLAE
jgi:hypothetical protein